MSGTSIGPKASYCVWFAFALLMLAAPIDAQTLAAATHETFVARTVNLSVGAGQDVKIDIFRWSTDDERQALMTALKNADEKALVNAIQKATSLGSVWTNESLGYTIRYAYAGSLANGTERVVVLVDGRLGSWSGQIWKPLRPPTGGDSPFSLIELRLNHGAGEGKMSLTSKVVADETGKTLALSDYDAAPVLLRPVKHGVEHQQ